MKNFCLSEERKSTDKGKITLNTMMISISLTDFGLGTKATVMALLHQIKIC
jgi:hypothetical protein